ncbi:hypothetical protein Celaphus_00008858 [Cervus elaphus hippelaphus]|uniref:Uncharacterized protein n=1 Tax=Cervus elaphus hippelaphus TaxID=46360 RepID=A0A212DIC2_CEREH|nr:hypothetical protein Celaphus_00008858 [Cervus elaphus hippelaphus]
MLLNQMRENMFAEGKMSLVLLKSQLQYL